MDPQTSITQIDRFRSVFLKQVGENRKIVGWNPPNQSSIFYRVFHYFHHPFGGTPIFGNTQVCFQFLLGPFACCCERCLEILHIFFQKIFRNHSNHSMVGSKKCQFSSHKIRNPCGSKNHQSLPLQLEFFTQPLRSKSTLGSPDFSAVSVMNCSHKSPSTPEIFNTWELRDGECGRYIWGNLNFDNWEWPPFLDVTPKISWSTPPPKKVWCQN